MKLYLLRHEERSLDDISFYSPLLDHGKDCANKLKYTLKNHNISVIFCSPFKRTMQTIEPFCNMTDLKVNIEYSLYEKLDNHIDQITKMNLLETDEEYYLINKDYQSFLNYEDLDLEDDGFNRTTNFLQEIIKKYKYTNENILFVTHSAIIKYIVNNSSFKPPPMGGLLTYDFITHTYSVVNYVEKKSVHFA